MDQITLTPVGYVVNCCNISTLPENISCLESIIVILPEYTDALYKIEQCSTIDVLFYMHKKERVSLISQTRYGEERGVFASRSPWRPNGIGVTRVKLLKVEDNQLFVAGLDALNGSPVLDIKCGF